MVRVAILVCLLVSNIVHAQISADIRFNYKRSSYKGCYYDVIITEKGHSYNLTWFKPWEYIDQVSLSPDSRYVLVHHKPQKGKKRLLSVYDLRTKKLVGRTSPGGGDFDWNNKDQVIHTWGCGTNCGGVTIFNTHMQQIFFTLSSGGVLFSPTKKYLVQYSMHSDRMWVFDLSDAAPGVKPLTCIHDIDSNYNSDNIRFKTETEIEFVHNTNTAKNYILHLKKMKWKRTATEDIGEYYAREF